MLRNADEYVGFNETNRKKPTVLGVTVVANRSGIIGRNSFAPDPVQTERTGQQGNARHTSMSASTVVRSTRQLTRIETSTVPEITLSQPSEPRRKSEQKRRQRALVDTALSVTGPARSVESSLLVSGGSHGSLVGRNAQGPGRDGFMKNA